MDHRTAVINIAVIPCCSIGDCCACYRCRWYQRVEKQKGNLCTSLVAYEILIHLVVREIYQQNTSLISTSSISIKVQKVFSSCGLANSPKSAQSECVSMARLFPYGYARDAVHTLPVPPIYVPFQGSGDTREIGHGSPDHHAHSFHFVRIS